MPLVGALVNISALIELGKDILHRLHVLFVGGTDKLIVADVEIVPGALDHVRNAVNELLRGNASLFSLVLDLFTMLVGTRQKEHVIALQALESCDTVRKDRLIYVADMRLAGGVGNGGGHIKLFLFHVFDLSMFITNSFRFS